MNGLFMERDKKNQVLGVLLSAFCLIALFGFILPSLNISINLLGYSYSKNINVMNMVSFFTESDLQVGELDIAKQDLFQLAGDNDTLASTGAKLIASVVSYFSTIILLLLVLIGTLSGMLKKSGLLKKIIPVMLMISFVLYVYAGYTISSLTAQLFQGIENSLGFFSAFINISDIINVKLGTGYWLTLSAIGCMLLITLFTGRFLTTPTEKSMEIG